MALDLSTACRTIFNSLSDGFSAFRTERKFNFAYITVGILQCCDILITIRTF